MAGGGGSTGGIGAQSPASGGFGGNMLSNMGNNTRPGNNSQLGQLGNMANAAGASTDFSMMHGGPHVGGGYGGGNPMAAPANNLGGIEQDQEFRNFRSQHDDLSRQMNEYMQKAPMYQQLQDLQGKMQGVQSRYAPQPQMQQPQQRGRYSNFNPMQQQLGGLAALLGGLGRR